MDFEVYVDTNAPPAEREAALKALFVNEDAAGIEYAVVMPSPTPKPDNLALFETAGTQRRAVLCCQVNPNDGESALAEIKLTNELHQLPHQRAARFGLDAQRPAR